MINTKTNTPWGPRPERGIKEVTRKPDTGGGPVVDMKPRPKKGPKGFKKPHGGV